MLPVRPRRLGSYLKRELEPGVTKQDDQYGFPSAIDLTSNRYWSQNSSNNRPL